MGNTEGLQTYTLSILSLIGLDTFWVLRERRWVLGRGDGDTNEPFGSVALPAAYATVEVLRNKRQDPGSALPGIGWTREDLQAQGAPNWNSPKGTGQSFPANLSPHTLGTPRPFLPLL